MIIINGADSAKFALNGILYPRNFMCIKQGTDSLAIHNAYDSAYQLLPSTKFNEIKVDGVIYSNQADLISALATILFAKNTIIENPNTVPSTAITLEDKTTLIDNDVAIIGDSSDGMKIKKTTWLNAWTNYIKLKVDALLATFKSNNFIDFTSSGQAQLDSKIPLYQKAIPMGVATLNVGGKLPAEQLNFGVTSGTVAEGNDTRIVQAFNKKVNAISVTGDSNKTITLTREDGTILTANFLDNNDYELPDDVLNTLTFNADDDGVLIAVTSLGEIISVSIDGRYSLIGHTHSIGEIDGLSDILDELSSSYEPLINGTAGVITKYKAGGGLEDSSMKSTTGDNATPSTLELDGTYRVGTPLWNKLKLYLFKGTNESYGFSVGELADLQYWAGTSSTGFHRFFTSQIERFRINTNGDIVVTNLAGTDNRLTMVDTFGTLSKSSISEDSTSIKSSKIIVSKTGTDGGFENASYTPNSHNNIWRIGDSKEYGIGYYQSDAGDYIGYHFGNRLTPQIKFRANGRIELVDGINPHDAVTINQLTSSLTGYQTAIGYTAANDSNVVHKTGNETIEDNKTFTGIVKLNKLKTPYIIAGSPAIPSFESKIEYGGDIGIALGSKIYGYNTYTESYETGWRFTTSDPLNTEKNTFLVKHTGIEIEGKGKFSETVQIANATASNHAVTLGQLTGATSSLSSNLTTTFTNQLNTEITNVSLGLTTDWVDISHNLPASFDGVILRYKIKNGDFVIDFKAHCNGSGVVSSVTDFTIAEFTEGIDSEKFKSMLLDHLFYDQSNTMHEIQFKSNGEPHQSVSFIASFRDEVEFNVEFRVALPIAKY